MPIGVPALYRAMIETRVPSRQFESMLRFRKTRKRDSKCFQELFVGKTSCLVPQTPNCPFLNRTCSLSKGPHEVIGLLQECQNNTSCGRSIEQLNLAVKRRRLAPTPGLPRAPFFGCKSKKTSTSTHSTSTFLPVSAVAREKGTPPYPPTLCLLFVTTFMHLMWLGMGSVSHERQ